MNGGGGGYSPARRPLRGRGAARPHPYRRDGPMDRPGYGYSGGMGMGYGGPRGGDMYRGGGGMMHPPAQARQPTREAAKPEEKIDRTKICPLFLRVFIRDGSHHETTDFAVRGEEPIEDSIIIYTWMDATLRELADLIQQVKSEARAPRLDLSFAFVYPDRCGKNVIKHVQTLSSIPLTRGRGARMDNDKTLKQLGFETGDFVDVALLNK